VVDGKKVDGGNGGAEDRAGAGGDQVLVAVTGIGVSPHCRASKRDKEDPVGSTRKLAQKVAKGGDGSGNGGEDKVMEDVVMWMEEEEEGSIGNLSQGMKDGGREASKETSGSS
jgi:hypothetical protein